MITTWSIAITTLCLLGFLPILRIAHCRSTSGHIVNAADYGNKQGPKARQCLYSCTVRLDSDDRMELNDALQSSGRQTCFEKCLAGNKQDKMGLSYKKRSNPRNQHLIPASPKRKKRDTNDGKITQICPNATTNATNVYATVANIEHKQYEDLKRWYVNISWNPLNESLVNFTGYAFVYWNQYLPSVSLRYKKRQKSETYIIYDEPASANNDIYFGFSVIALPCQTDIIDLTGEVPPRNVTEDTSTTSSTAPPTINKTVYIIVAIGTLACIVTIACVLRYKYFLREKRPSRPADFRYDAFIIFNNKDQSWVDGILLPILEVEHGLKCCVHYRDFEPGKPFVDNMTDSVQSSRNTIAVVSENFFTSEFCKYELDQAIYKHVKEGFNAVIVIRIDSASKDKLPDALKNKSFVDYSNLIERKTWHLKLIKVLTSS